MPLFNGSIVDGMLSELAQRWTAAPDCAEPCNVGDVRFHLEVIANERRHASGLFEQSGPHWQGDSDDEDDDEEEARAAAGIISKGVDQALQLCSDDTLAILLDCHAAWCHDGDAWQVRMESSASATAGAQARAAVLRDIKQVAKQAKLPASAERTLTYLVQLLRDAAYAKLSLHHKVYQLEQLLLIELHRLEGTARGGADRSNEWAGFANARAAHNPGRIDSGECEMAASTPHPAVEISSAARCVALTAEDAELEDEPGGFTLHRAVCGVRTDLPASRRNASTADIQAVAFFSDAQAALAHVLQSAGASRKARAEALLTQLAPVMRASLTSWENARQYVGTARQQTARLRATQARAAIRADMDILEAALESYATAVLMWVEGDPDPPLLSESLESARLRMTSVLKPTLRAMLPEYDRNRNRSDDDDCEAGGDRGDGNCSEDGSEYGSEVDGSDQASDASDAGSDGGVDGANARAPKWTMARKLMLQAWPVAWLTRIGSIQRLPNWTFLNTLMNWFETRGKATGSLQRGRGMRQYSHHSAIDPYLEVRAARVMERLRAGPPETVPGFAHSLSWLDNFLKYLNMVEERRQRSADAEKHATMIGYEVPRRAAAHVPRRPICIPSWNWLPEGTVLSWAKPRFVCTTPYAENSYWAGVTVSELRIGTQLCNRYCRSLSADALQLKWYEALGEELSEHELAEHAPQLTSLHGRTSYSLVPLVDHAAMLLQSGTLQMLSKAQHYHKALHSSKCKHPIPPYRFRWPEVRDEPHGQLSEPKWSETCVGWAERSRQINPTVWDGPEKFKEADRRFGPFLADVREVETAGNLVAHERLQELVHPAAQAAATVPSREAAAADGQRAMADVLLSLIPTQPAASGDGAGPSTAPSAGPGPSCPPSPPLASPPPLSPSPSPPLSPLPSPSSSPPSPPPPPSSPPPSLPASPAPPPSSEPPLVPRPPQAPRSEIAKKARLPRNRSAAPPLAAPATAPTAPTAAPHPPATVYSSSQYSDAATDTILMSTIQSLESMLYNQTLGTEEEVQRVVETLQTLWTVDPLGGGLHFMFCADEVGLSTDWDYKGGRAAKDIFTRTNFDPTKPAQAHRPKTTFKEQKMTAWFIDASAAFHDTGAASLPTSESEAATFDYDAYYRDFMVFIERNAAIDVECRKHSSQVFKIFLPGHLLAQAEHWGEFEVVRTMGLLLLGPIDAFGSWKYARLKARLELRYHCRSAIVNALNDTHVGHSLSGNVGKLQPGDVLPEDHVMQMGIIASTAIQPHHWERKMCTRALNIGCRKQLLRTIGQNEWSGLATSSKAQRQKSSVTYETNLMARADLRISLNRPDPARTLLRQNELGWVLKAHILRISDAAVPATCSAPCFNYVFKGMQPLLSNAAALQADLVGADDVPNGAVTLAITARPVGVRTGGGGAFKVHPVDGNAPPTATGYLRIRSGTWEEVVLSQPERRSLVSCQSSLRLELWDDGGLSELLGKPRPVQLLKIQWERPPSRTLQLRLPGGSVVTQVKGRPLEHLFNPPNDAPAQPLNAIAQDIIEALLNGRPIGLACALDAETLAEQALEELSDAPPDLELCKTGGRWLWLYHPRLNPSARETTGFPKARVPGMLEELLREAAPPPSEAMEVENESEQGAAAPAPATGLSLRQSTTQRCESCRGGIGQCLQPGKLGHLPEELAYCLACSGARGKDVKTDASLRRPCQARGRKYKESLGRKWGQHWPEEALQPAPPAEVVELGGRPSHWRAKVAEIRAKEGESSSAGQATAERRLNVINLLHDHNAKDGSATAPRLPANPPGRKALEQSKITVTDRLLQGDLPLATHNHELKYVVAQLNELVADGEASRFARDLANGARPLSEALSRAAPPVLSAAPPVQGPGAQAARALRTQRVQAAKKQREAEHEIRVQIAVSERTIRELEAKLSKEFHLRDRQRGGLQRSAGVTRKADQGELHMAEADLAAEEKQRAKLRAKLMKAQEAVRRGPDSSLAGSSSQAGPSSLSSQGMSASTLLQTTDRLGNDAKVGDYALIDGADDWKHGDGVKDPDGRQLRYYLIRITRVRRVLTAPLQSDWGTLAVGTHVVDAEYYFLVYKPGNLRGNPAHWYVAGQPSRAVVVPTHLLLRVGFSMPPALLGPKPSREQKAACKRHAVVLSDEEHVSAVATLRRR